MDIAHGKRAALLVVALSAVLLLGGCSLVAGRSAETKGGAGTTTDLYQYSDASTAPQRSSAGAPEVAGEQALPVEPAPGGTGSDASKVAQRLIILDKTLRMRVTDVPKSVESIRSLATKHKGLVTNMQVSSEDGVPVYNMEAQQRAGYDGAPLAGYMTVRVPNAQFEAFIAEAAKLGTVLRQTQNSQDVTQEHVDLAARLGNLRAEEKRLREFFTAAKKVSEMLEIERELARVRGEIESLDAQVKYLERQAAMATVTFELVEPQPVVRPQGESWGVTEALTQSIRAFVGTVNGLIILLGPVLALALFVGLPIALIVRALIKRRRKGSAPSASDGGPTEK